MESYENIIIGTGEIGMPLYELMAGVYRTLPIDPVHFPKNDDIKARCTDLHICIPGNFSDFEDIVIEAAKKYNAYAVYIHSTVIPGTTKRINDILYKDRNFAVHCPVHGKHHNNSMKKDMLRYPKYVGVEDNCKYAEKTIIREHFERIGFHDVRLFDGSENTEWLKILSTTYFGLQIAWAQEVERICDECGLDYDVVADFFPIQEDAKEPIFPGVIGGHCVMPNIELIKRIYESELLNWMEWSNRKKEERDKND